jgi:hypothetical protein
MFVRGPCYVISALMWEVKFRILVSFLQVYLHFLELNWDIGSLEELIAIQLIWNLSLL